MEQKITNEMRLQKLQQIYEDSGMEDSPEQAIMCLLINLCKEQEVRIKQLELMHPLDEYKLKQLYGKEN